MFRSDTHSGTFQEFTRRLFNNIKKLSNCYSLVDIISDQYLNNSLKNGLKLLFNDDTPLPSKFSDCFSKDNDNKEQLSLYCADKFQSYQ